MEGNVNQANEAVDIALLAMDYTPYRAAIAYGIACVTNEHGVEFNKHLTQYIYSQCKQAVTA